MCTFYVFSASWSFDTFVTVWFLSTVYKCCYVHINFKLASLTFKAIHTGIPPYLFYLLTPYCPSRVLRSSYSSNLLQVPRTNLTFGSRSFRAAARTVWNSLPDSLRSSEILCRLLWWVLFYLWSWVLIESAREVPILTNLPMSVMINQYSIFSKSKTVTKFQNTLTFLGSGGHSVYFWYLKIKTCTYQMCKWQSANTNVLIGGHRLSADYRCISNNNNNDNLCSWMTEWTGRQSHSSMVRFHDHVSTTICLDFISVGMVEYLPMAVHSHCHQSIYILIRLATDFFVLWPWIN